MKKCLSIVILLTLFAVSCTHTPTTKGEGTGETGTTSETATNVAPAVAQTEAELGILHPLRFADDVKIYQADDVLHRKEYEVPYRLDEHRMLIVGHPLARGKLSAQRIERTPDSPDYTTTAVGYYDLERSQFVAIADVSKPPYPTSDELMQMRLYALDETRLLYETFHPGTMEYFTYSFADGKLERLDRFEWDTDNGYPGRPHVSGDRLYLPTPLENGRVASHIYDRKTLEKIETRESGYDLRAYRGEDVYMLYAPNDAPNEWQAWIGDQKYVWDTNKGENLLGIGVTTKPEAVYFLSQFFGTHELDEDLTAEDRAQDPDRIGYQVLREMPADHLIARVRGAYLDAQVTDAWVGFRKTPVHDPEGMRMAYVYLPEEKTALRITLTEPCRDFYLLQSEPYAVLFGDQTEDGKSLTVYTFEQTESH